MANETEISRGGASVTEQRTAQIRAKLSAMVEKEKAKAKPELAEAPWWAYGQQWDIFAMGPYQEFQYPPGSGMPPGRIVMAGETAYIDTFVWLNPEMAAAVRSFGSCISLGYHTANTQTMKPVSDLDAKRSVDPELMKPIFSDPWLGDFYLCTWKFQPKEAGCLYETNICARLCTCKDTAVPGYAAFVRWVYDFDWDAFFGSPGWEFNNPIRYLVADAKSPCGPCHQLDCD